MKKKTLLLVLITGSIGLFYPLGYAATIWRHQGTVSVHGQANSRTWLYINGDMQFVNGQTPSVAPAMMIENSRVRLTGDFINDVTRGPQGGNLFFAPSSNDYGVLEFCGSSPQAITTSGTTNTNIPSKLDNYINFPDIEVNNSKHLTLDSRLAAKVQDISLNKGWLILDSKLAEANVDAGVEVLPAQESVLAHLLVAGDIDYKESTWASKTDANERGFIQVNLKIPGESSRNAKSIVGMGIPFNEMRNDYFMFNTLLEPQAGYTNGNGFLAIPPLINPETVMTAGKGYVVGIDLRGTDPKEYGALEEYEGIINFDQRATDGYRFNRHAFAGYAPDNQLFGTTPTTDAYVKEKLNTEDITVSLAGKPGYTYLANPYTCPMNIDKLLGEDQAQSTWKIQSDKLANRPQMRNQVWVLAPNSVAEPTGDSRYSKYTYNYQVAMKTGGTYTDYDNVAGVTAIAPLQMFLIRNYSTATSITIPKSERVMGTTRFLRSAPQDDRRRDDFIIEFRDMATNTTDRASIVLRTEEELKNNKNYVNVERLESTSTESSNGLRSATVIQGDFAQSLASQIYTKDETGKALTVQFIPTQTTKITLYHIPSSEAQALNILGLRLNTKDRITRIWLEDSKYNTEVEITPETVYGTYSEPTDRHDRFRLRFSTETTGINDNLQEQNMIYAYAAHRNIYVQGFGNAEFGSNVELYDVNGRLITRKTAKEEKLLLHENCLAGVYIVKSGNKTFKLIAK
ncbi:T9SS C-terminal target domain-containing protein [Dysgonomonas sp. 216]|uniref:T9SS type A sorting domain-containing protein n=1 Tax=Dysgonomonas sp. 216 TaxID=2302934 RepID=UPI0013D207EA|nr:T9SS type A sorting domain-containing protein [Dysgonomonas sp. 216]NDW18746.1 T9SS C-terminal target domain-containing protein [Dysgonomonas sp. 216]